MNRRRKGACGEQRAAQFLRERGCHILAMNFRCRRGEIDIVALDRDEVVFVEVKNWDALEADSLEYAIGWDKRNRIRDTALFFLHQHEELQEKPMRFDVILCRERPPGLDHLKNAFGGV